MKKVETICTALLMAVMLLFANRTHGTSFTQYWGGGTADIADDTPLPQETNLLSGTWNATLKNWATSATPGVYGVFSNGAFANLGFFAWGASDSGPVLSLGNDVAIGGLMAMPVPTNASTYNQRFTLTAGSDRTLTLADGAVVNVVGNEGVTTRGLWVGSNVRLACGGTLTCVGAGKVVVASASTGLTSQVAAQAGIFQVEASGSIPQLPLITLHSVEQQPGGTGGGSIPQPTLLVYAANASGTINQLKDDAVISMARGKLQYRGRNHATSATDETIGQLVLQPHGTLVLSGNEGSGADRPTLALAHPSAGINRGTGGRGTLIVDVASGGSPLTDVIVSNGVATGTLLPWIATTRAEFMRVNSTTRFLETVPSTAAPPDVTTWVAGSDYRCGNNSASVLYNTIGSDLAINSLGFFNTGNSTVQVASGVTLTISSGGIAYSPVPGANSFIIGGNLTAGNAENRLYILTGDSTAAGNFFIDSNITGSGMELIKAGIANLTLRGAGNNTYSGTTYVNCGQLTANKSGAAVAIPGNLVIECGGAFVVSGGSAPISSTSAVTIKEGGVFSHTGGSVTHGAAVTIEGGRYHLLNMTPTINVPGTGLIFNGGRVSHNSGGAGTLNLQTDVSYASTATKQARFERYGSANFFIALNGANRTFNIADSASLPPDVPEMVIDANIVPGTPAGGRITKTGAGTLQITDHNTYAGGTTINGGVLRVSRISAPAQSGLQASVAAGNVPNAAIVTFVRPVARQMAVRQPISSAAGTSIIPSGRTIAEIVNDYQVLMNGPVNNPANLSDVQVSAISRSGSLGTGAVIVNNGGTLQIDAGVSVTNFTVVAAGGTAVIDGALAGALVNSGTVKGGGTILTLTNAAGGVVAPGASIGVMNISGNAVFQNASEWEVEWNDGVTNDIIVVNGNFTALGQPVIKVLNIGGTPNINTQVILKVTGTYTGPASGYQFNLPANWNAITTGGDLINMGGGNYGIAFIPEPGVIGLAALAVLALRRK
ncbi:MAG: autotransporter-associated beta strand repeat-containing protein [bacterium]|nr:autotransporter-associated beta strand repeat-containing protein [bacterium]